MERHFKTSRQPMFTYIQTMSAHWPYDYTYEPEVDVPGGAPGTDPEMHEYLRRRVDGQDGLRLPAAASCERRFPSERFLIVHYGDHHPMATRTLLGFDNDTEAEDVTLDPEFDRLHHLLRGARHQLSRCRRCRSSRRSTCAYLGTVILDLAGLPLSDSHRERKRLMAAVQGALLQPARRATRSSPSTAA